MIIILFYITKQTHVYYASNNTKEKNRALVQRFDVVIIVDLLLRHQLNSVKSLI